MQPIIIIQARTGSTRLPYKMVKPFYKDESILDILLKRLLLVSPHLSVSNIVVATTDNSEDTEIENICKIHHVQCFRGSESDVLQRFIDAAEKYKADKIIRICADNIFLDLESLVKLANFFNTSNYDYVSYKKQDGTPSILTHYGFFTEAVKLDVLKEVAETTNDIKFHEHVTNCIYSHPEIYNIKLFPIEEVIPGLENHKYLRLTLDTFDDFEIQNQIYSDLISSDTNINPKEIIRYLDLKHPELYIKMRDIINRNKK